MKIQDSPKRWGQNGRRFWGFGGLNVEGVGVDYGECFTELNWIDWVGLWRRGWQKFCGLDWWGMGYQLLKINFKNEIDGGILDWQNRCEKSWGIVQRSLGWIGLD